MKQDIERKRREQPTILLVEKDSPIRFMLACSLSREAYRCATVVYGRAATEAWESRTAKIDLAILGVQLTELAEGQFLRHLRSSHQDVPVLLTPTESGSENERHGRALQILNSLWIEVTEIKFWPERCRATTGGSEVKFQPKDSGLLMTHAMESARMFERRGLLNQGWGADFGVKTRMVDIHIPWIRSRLRAAELRNSMIWTVYSTGYQIAFLDGGSCLGVNSAGIERQWQGRL